MLARLVSLSAVTRAGAVVGLLAACNSNPMEPDSTPAIPTQWAAAITNPYYSIAAGMTWEYRGQTSNGLETNTVQVLSETKVVSGVTAAVVWDRVYLNGDLIEETHDWFAQDADGNVWYLGEDSKEYQNGVVTSTEGSWEGGVDGARPGVIMWADPAAHVGESYRQEYYKDQAEDWGKVIAAGQTVVVPFGTLTNCIKTVEWSALESNSDENKYYCPSLGTVLETDPSGGNRSELITHTSASPRPIARLRG